MSRSGFNRTTVLSAAILASLATPAFAQEAQDAGKTLDTVIVTGTHVSNRTVAESQSPIDVISNEALKATGAEDLATALSRALPSLNFPRPALNDGTSGVRPAQLRGLAPDEVLVLVDGKRRHLSAQLNVNGSIGRGSEAVDFNTIPVAAIDHVEVLRDGASAQYGSDAIAGVVNIVLKKAGHGGSVTVDAGEYSAGDGKQGQLSGDVGFSFAGDRGYVHLAAQAGSQDETNRAGPYQGTTPNTGNNPADGTVGFVVGDPKVDFGAVSAVAGFRFNDEWEAYATAIASNRDIDSRAFYRSVGADPVVPQVYPNGYAPVINQYSQDRSLVAGVKGGNDNGWTWDFSYNYGQNHLAFNTRNSINYSLGVDSPHAFYDGALEYTQNLLDADFTKTLNLGFADPALLSFGAEYRYEKWNESPGEPGSYENGGAQGFGGFTPLNSVHSDRHNEALYVGLDQDFTDKFSAGIAGRWENYSDFGSQTSGKLSARYAFTPKVALRGTVASGFRAPSLAQQNYQAITSTYNNNVFVDRGTFPADSAAAKALGAEPLKPEKSLSYSLGLVLQPTDRLYVTIDAYQIKIDDRILLSSAVNTNQATQDLLSGLGIDGVTAFNYFTNAADTKTKGIDVVGEYTIPLAASSLKLTGSYGYNKTDITSVAPNPQVLVDLGLPFARFGRDEQGRITEGYPKDKLILGGSWDSQRWDLSLTATRYGEFTSLSATNPANDQTFGAKWLLDASASFKPSKNWAFTLGADNFLDTYPDQNIPANANSGQFKYSFISPYGFNGAYVYGRASYKW